jgi:hypothetical protein
MGLSAVDRGKVMGIGCCGRIAGDTTFFLTRLKEKTGNGGKSGVRVSCHSMTGNIVVTERFLLFKKSPG